MCIEEAVFTLQAHRDRALHYKMEEVQVTVVDELYVEQNSEGIVYARLELQLALNCSCVKTFLFWANIYQARKNTSPIKF